MPVYLKYGNINGETKGKYKGWIELQSCQFGLGRGTSTPVGTSSKREASAPSLNEIGRHQDHGQHQSTSSSGRHGWESSQGHRRIHDVRQASNGLPAHRDGRRDGQWLLRIGRRRQAVGIDQHQFQDDQFQVHCGDGSSGDGQLSLGLKVLRWSQRGGHVFILYLRQSIFA